MGLLASATSAEETLSTVSIDHDPKTILEFSQIVQGATAKHAVCVRFPSGEWNWYCVGHVELPKKNKLVEWAASDRELKTEDLDRWLGANKVTAVQILMSADCNPATYFKVEQFLRGRKILYWVVSPDASSSQKEHIRLLETDGKASPHSGAPESPGK